MSKLKSTLHRIAAKLRSVSAEKEGNGIIEAVVSGDEILAEIKYVLKSGIEPLDMLTGCLPFGRVVEIFGLEASGKTATMINLAAKATEGEIYRRTRIVGAKGGSDPYLYEKLDPSTYEVSVLFIDNEHSLDDSGVIEINGRRIQVVISRCETVEGVFKCVDETIKILRKIEEESEKMQFLVVVVDTIAGTATKEELSQAWDKDDYSRKPKQLQEGFRNLAITINKHNALVICTNQVGDQLGYQAPKGVKMHKPDWRAFSPPGGKALKFWSSLRVFMWQQPTKYKLVKDAGFQAGLLIGFEIVKSRSTAPYREGRLVILFDRDGGGGLRNDFSILETMLQYKVAEEDEDRNIIFKLKKHGVKPTTFPELVDLFDEPDEEDDEDIETPKKKSKKGPKYKDPRISNRAAWPKFYAAHKADMDQMWHEVVKIARVIKGMGHEETESEETLDDNDNDSEQAEERTKAPAARPGRRNPLNELIDNV